MSSNKQKVLLAPLPDSYLASNGDPSKPTPDYFFGIAELWWDDFADGPWVFWTNGSGIRLQAMPVKPFEIYG